MPVEEILGLLRAQPFTPFSLHLLEGTSYEVRHPEAVLVTRRSLTLGLNAEPPFYLAERTVLISLLAIGRIEILEMVNRG
jgi:hypothetical protein